MWIGLLGCLLFFSLLTVASARAAEDIEPPVLESLTISPSSINTTSAGQTVIVKAHISDRSGVHFANVKFFSSAGKQGEDADLELLSGTEQDGEFEAQVPFPQYSEAGTWKIEVILPDRAGNLSTLNATELEAAGFPATVEVEDTNVDTEPPALESLSISPSVLSAASAIRTVTVTAHIVAGESPVRFPNVEFFSPTGKQGEDEDLELVSGTDTNGIYEAKVPFPAYAEAGTWKVDILLSDYVNNFVELNAPRLESEGFPTTVRVESLVEDTEPPLLTALSISPSSVNVTSSGQTVRVKALITDNLSGVRYANVKFFSPAGAQGENPDFELVSGTDTNGEYEAEVPFSQYSEAGTWKIDVRLTDHAGNVAELEAPQLESEGFPTTMLVENAPTEAEPNLALKPAMVLSPASTNSPNAAAPLVTAAPFAGASIVSASPSASASGTVSLRVSCQAASTCTGTVTLSAALTAGGHRSRRHNRTITLAVGSFDLSTTGTVKLHLSAGARRLLARVRVLRAKATIIADDGSGVAHTSTTTLTLRLPRSRAHSD